MKKEDLQNPQQEKVSFQNNDRNRNQKKEEPTNISDTRNTDLAHQAGLGRYRMTDIERMGEMSEEDDFLVSDNDDLKNKNLNASNDQ